MFPKKLVQPIFAPKKLPTGGQCRRLSLDHLEGFSGALLRAAELESWSLRHVKVEAESTWKGLIFWGDVFFGILLGWICWNKT